MSKAQRTAILEAHALKMIGRYHSGVVVARPNTVEVLKREKWISDALARSGYVTRAGLIAAGVDMDAIHTEALNEYREVTRAARKADADAYQRELLRAAGLKVKGDPIPVLGPLRST